MLMNCSFSSELFKEEGEGSYQAFAAADGGDGSGDWARPCDSCRSASSAVYCRADAVYLCAACDARLHALPAVARHERVWVCEACECAPAAVTCRADAAAMCADCDVQVHSANPLARRHHRVPILPLPLPATAAAVTAAAAEAICQKEPELEVAAGESWPFLNKNYYNNEIGDAGLLLGAEVDEYLDLTEYNYDPCYEQKQEEQRPSSYRKNEGSECVVPSQQQLQQQRRQQQQQQQQQHEASNTAGFSYTASYGHSVSFSTMEASVVPDSTMADISNSYLLHSKGATDLLSGPSLQLPLHLNSVDREARVLRYREKRKMRKFEKTIRYASRKAYAESRPRIKGRFAKRSDAELEVDQMFSTTVISDDNYGIVLSF